jgi:hypothetical protein
MNIYESIIKGLNEAIAYEKCENAVHAARITIIPLSEVSAEDANHKQ